MEPDSKIRERSEATEESESPSCDRFGRTNWILLAVGIVSLALGFYLLSMADERAANLAGRISPFVILGGYGVIFVSLILRSSK